MSADVYRYILLVGLPGSGKDAAAGLISREFGHFPIRMSDLVRLEVEKSGLEVTRETLRDVGSALRSRMGPAAVAKMVLERIRSLEGEGVERFVVNGIRNPEEVDEFRAALGDEAVVVGLVAPRRARFLRLLGRGREGFDPASWAKFVAEDREEIERFNLGNALALADVFVNNDSDVETFRERLFRAVRRVS